jgi:nucleoside-diphosphate-sugar epimerase
MSEPQRILVTGALGQIGSELTLELRRIYGADNVVATDIRECTIADIAECGSFEICDVLDPNRLAELCGAYDIDSIVHMAAVLSATGERNPDACWNVNINGSLNVLRLARERGLTRVLIPSSIAAFGPETPQENTPQETVLRPRTMYGVTKVAGELLADYFWNKWGVDVRGLRYPGIISAKTLPGGGTTDYAVDIYYKAVSEPSYTCFVKPETRLPMMYMPDCLKATVDLFRAPVEGLKHHGDFNVGSMSFSAGELAAAIQRRVPGFEVRFEPDYRQAIADSWPSSVDDSAARREWGWSPDHDLESMTDDMLERLSARHAAGELYPD